MIPTIDMKATGIRLKRIMKMYGFSVKDVQQYLAEVEDSIMIYDHVVRQKMKC